MVIIKSYTSLEQSKKLAEILPLESADMDYFPIVNIDGEYSIGVNEWDNDHVIEEGWIPSWSLSALLSVLPYPDIKQRYDGNWVCRVENKDTTYLWIDSNPIDACVAVIEKLHEENIL
jgi:hypothetical protein